MIDDGWVLRTERELGAITERQRSLEASGASLRVDVKEGFKEQQRALAEAMAAMSRDVERVGGHVRGEIQRLDQLLVDNRKADERAAEERARQETRRQEDLIASLKQAASTAEAKVQQTTKINQRIIFAIVVAGVCAQQVLDNLPVILQFLETVFS